MLNLDARETVQNVFSPMVGVISSPLAEDICLKNNLTFVEMLQPFTRLSTDAYFHDTTGVTNSIKGTRINICDIAWRPPQTMLARKLLTESVASAQADEQPTRPVRIGDAGCPADCITIHVPGRQLWFEQWRETLLSVQAPADHEFTRHLLGALIVLSSGDPTPLDTAQQLTRQVHALQTQSPPPKMPKWFAGGSELLNCYVLLHDASQGADISRAQQSYESLKLTFGEHRCFLLQINSLKAGASDATASDVWSKYVRRQQHGRQADGVSMSSGAGEQSTPRTPQDLGPVNMVYGLQVAAGSPLETPPTSITINEEIVDHPLSPVQENAIEAIHSNISTSCESLGPVQPVLNPNVWAAASGPDAASDSGPHGQCLAPADLDNLKHFVQDYTIRSLIPYVEKLIGALTEAVTNKKGRSILSVTKRWFITNKPASGSLAGAALPNAIVYAGDSAELQTRKLGDLYFMFGNYKQAFEQYHQAKRDFSADSAWQYYAGALEMAALSAFMAGTATKKTYDYMEEAIVTYANNCRLPQFATRATLLSTECLRHARLHGDAAKQLIRMTSEDSDLRSALLLEQAAYAFLANVGQPLHRKYAFHIVLAGHRFAKANQRRHAFRCYRQAYAVFEGRGWSLAEDHIQYTIGKQAVQLKRMDEASAALAHLLRPSSLQSNAQQAAFLREYIATQKANGGGAAQLVDVPLPQICAKATRVLVAAHPPVTVPGLIAATNIRIDSNLQDEWKWQKLEEIVVQIAAYKPVMIFKPTTALFTSEFPTADCPLAVHGEPIDISFTLENTIKPPITFEDVHLLWSFQPDEAGTPVTRNDVLFADGGDSVLRSQIEQIVTSTPIRSVQLNECERQTLSVRLVPRRTGRLCVEGVVGRLSLTNEPNSLWGRLTFDPVPIDGPNAAAAPGQTQPQQYDQKLHIDVLPAMPSLQVQFSAVPVDVLAGEVIAVQVTLTNAGANALGDIWAASEVPRWLLGDERDLPLSVLKDFRDLTNETLIRDKEARRQHAFRLLRAADGTATAIGPHETRTTTIHLQAPLQRGATDLKMLIYYAMPETTIAGQNARIRYRLVRHQWHLNVNDSLSLSVSANIGNMHTTELGADVQVNNLNQVHHPLMTEIVPLELHAYCGRYAITGGPVFLHGPNARNARSEGDERTRGLRTMESLSLRLALCERETSDSAADAVEFVRRRLTNIALTSAVDERFACTASMRPPGFDRLDSFLMKTETKYIGQLGQTGNNELFNQIVTDVDRHMTFALTWTALVNDNMSQQRVAFGQHFVQLRKLYDTVSCPPREKLMQPFAGHEELYDLYNFKESLDVKQWTHETDDWDDNDVSVARRCFLDVDEIDDLANRTMGLVHG